MKYFESYFEAQQAYDDYVIRHQLVDLHVANFEDSLCRNRIADPMKWLFDEMTDVEKKEVRSCENVDGLRRRYNALIYMNDIYKGIASDIREEVAYGNISGVTVCSPEETKLIRRSAAKRIRDLRRIACDKLKVQLTFAEAAFWFIESRRLERYFSADLLKQTVKNVKDIVRDRQDRERRRRLRAQRVNHMKFQLPTTRNFS